MPALLAAVLIVGASKLVGDPPPQQWIVWRGTAFSSPATFARWLRARGSSYREWAHAHPAAAARLEGREAPPEKKAARSPRAAAASEAKPKAKPKRAAQERVTSRRTSPAQANRDASARLASEQGRASLGPELLLVPLLLVAGALVALDLYRTL